MSIQYSSDNDSWSMLLSELNTYKEKLTLAKHLLADQNDLILNITSRYNLLVEGMFYYLIVKLYLIQIISLLLHYRS